MGRPSDYTTELGEEICARLIDADRGIEEVCEADDMPTTRTVFRWIAKHDEFCQAYTHARELQGEIQAGRGMKEALGATDAALGRLKFDARRWAASKLAPRKYGDKVTQELTGPGGVPLTDEAAVAARLASILSNAAARKGETA